MYKTHMRKGKNATIEQKQKQKTKAMKIKLPFTA